MGEIRKKDVMNNGESRVFMIPFKSIESCKKVVRAYGLESYQYYISEPMTTEEIKKIVRK